MRSLDLGPDMRTLGALLAQRARWQPDALAFAEGGEGLTYSGLADAARALAGCIGAVGVRPGSRVALLVPPGLEFIRIFYALQWLGAVPCAFDPRAPAATAARRAARVQPDLVLTAGEQAGDLVQACVAAGLRCVRSVDLARHGAALPWAPATIGDDATAYLQPTSGTSGEPRVAVLSQRNVIGWLAAACDMYDPAALRTLVSWAPPWHDLGLVRFVIGAVFLGAPCHLVPPGIHTLGTWLRTAAAVRATLIGAPDFAYRLAARLVDPAGLDLSALRCAIDGGEPVRRSTIAAFEERFGVRGVVRPGYGLAEATLGVTCTLPGQPLRSDPRGNVSCGQACDGVELRIAGQTGEPGEILVRGVGVFSGYFDAAEASAQALRDGWLHTGDVGALDAAGNLYVLGRRRALLKRGGATLAPREIEEAADQVPGVRLSAAIARPSGGAVSEGIVVVVEAEPAHARPAGGMAAAVAAAVEQAIGFAPDSVLVAAPRTIPRTRNGKIRHQALQDLLVQGELVELSTIPGSTFGAAEADRGSPL